MHEKLIIQKFAAEKFSQFGFHKVTMDQLARELHISKKTIYKHFPDKTGLVRAATEMLTSGIRKSIENVVSGDYSSVHKLHLIGKILLKVLPRMSDMWLFDLKTHYFFIWEEVDQFRARAINENFIKIIKQGQEEGYIVRAHPNIVLAILRNSIQGVINPEFLINNDITAKDAGKETLSIVFSGFLTKKGRKIYKQTISEDKK